MSLLRVFGRMVGVVWMLVLALFGLAVAMYCVDALVGLGSVRPDRLLGLPGVRRHVGRFLDQVAAPGSTAGLALLCGLGAVLLGIVLLIGALGSRKTTADRERRLRARGVDDAGLARIHSPCGLDIGSRTAEETAISVLAEIISVRAQRCAAPLRETSSPIHTRQRSL